PGADQRAGQHQPAGSAALDRSDHGVGAGSEEEHMASGLLNRNINAATGVRAMTAPARRLAASPNHRFTAAERSPTAATPSMACGRRMLQLLTPNTRAVRAIG